MRGLGAIFVSPAMHTRALSHTATVLSTRTLSRLEEALPDSYMVLILLMVDVTAGRLETRATNDAEVGEAVLPPTGELVLSTAAPLLARRSAAGVEGSAMRMKSAQKGVVGTEGRKKRENEEERVMNEVKRGGVRESVCVCARACVWCAGARAC